MSEVVKYGWLLIDRRDDDTWKVEQPVKWFDTRQSHSNVRAVFDTNTNRPIRMEAIEEMPEVIPDKVVTYYATPMNIRAQITGANLKLTFEGATNELKSAEVI
jgi:hypothetical protein